MFNVIRIFKVSMAAVAMLNISCSAPTEKEKTMTIETERAFEFTPEQVYAAWVAEETIVPPVTRIEKDVKIGGHYRLYVEMADRISQRRAGTNTFMMMANSTLIVLAGFLIERLSAEGWEQVAVQILIPATGLVLSAAWWSLIRSYRLLNTGKFSVIHEIELMLPLTPYAAEWIALGQGKDKKKYWPLTHVEQIVPWAFGAIYVAAIILMIANAA